MQYNVLESASDKYKKFNSIIENNIYTVAPEHTMLISAKNRYVELWVTQGLIKVLTEKLRPYKLSLNADSTDEVCQKYVSYRNKYNKLKSVLRLNYYNSKCMQYKSNIKQLWKVINQVIDKINDKASCIDCIKVDHIEYYQPKDISNHLGKYFADIGQNFAEKNATTLQINFRIYR